MRERQRQRQRQTDKDRERERQRKAERDRERKTPLPPPGKKKLGMYYVFSVCVCGRCVHSSMYLLGREEHCSTFSWEVNYVEHKYSEQQSIQFSAKHHCICSLWEVNYVEDKMNETYSEQQSISFSAKHHCIPSLWRRQLFPCLWLFKMVKRWRTQNPRWNKQSGILTLWEVITRMEVGYLVDLNVLLTAPGHFRIIKHGHHSTHILQPFC